MSLVLSLFPGIGLLDRAFEEEGFCVVRGPDLLWGGDIHRFSPPAGVFDGMIGGPPCQAFSKLRHIVKAKGLAPKPNLIPEYERVVGEAMPRWYLMENVEDAPEPRIGGYKCWPRMLNNRWFGAEQNRERRFTIGLYVPTLADKGFCDPWRFLDVALFEAPVFENAVLATTSKTGSIAKSQAELRDGASRRLKREGASVLPGQMPRRAFDHCCVLQGLPPNFLADAPFTSAGKYEVVGNGVPLPMGRAVARAVKRAMSL